jgi:hypothetical protein
MDHRRRPAPPSASTCCCCYYCCRYCFSSYFVRRANKQHARVYITLTSYCI